MLQGHPAACTWARGAGIAPEPISPTTRAVPLGRTQWWDALRCCVCTAASLVCSNPSLTERTGEAIKTSDVWS